MGSRIASASDPGTFCPNRVWPSTRVLCESQQKSKFLYLNDFLEFKILSIISRLFPLKLRSATAVTLPKSPGLLGPITYLTSRPEAYFHSYPALHIKIPFQMPWQLPTQSNLDQFRDCKSKVNNNTYLYSKTTLIPSFEAILLRAAMWPIAKSTTWIQSRIPVPSGVSQSLPNTTSCGRRPIATKKSLQKIHVCVDQTLSHVRHQIIWRSVGILTNNSTFMSSDWIEVSKSYVRSGHFK